jgi:hypothetical protein
VLWCVVPGGCWSPVRSTHGVETYWAIRCSVTRRTTACDNSCNSASHVDSVKRTGCSVLGHVAQQLLRSFWAACSSCHPLSFTQHHTAQLMPYAIAATAGPNSSSQEEGQLPGTWRRSGSFLSPASLCTAPSAAQQQRWHESQEPSQTLVPDMSHRNLPEPRELTPSDNSVSSVPCV